MTFNSKEYWENRYKCNGTSGSGSYGILCDYKSQIINNFILENDIKSVVEFGCGDGNQLSKIKCDNYVGYDVSEHIINKCKQIFINDSSKSFFIYDDYDNKKYDLSLSLDVIYHLVEDDVFDKYMDILFSSSSKYVIIYSSNGDSNVENMSLHLKDRIFTNWVYKNTDFTLIKKVDNIYKYDKNNSTNTSISDFFIYKKT